MVAWRVRCGLSIGPGGFCRQKNWQNSVLFLVSFMHVWYVDKKNGAEFEELPAIRFVWFCHFHCFSSRICHLFEQNPPVPICQELRQKTLCTTVLCRMLMSGAPQNAQAGMSPRTAYRYNYTPSPRLRPPTLCASLLSLAGVCSTMMVCGNVVK